MRDTTTSAPEACHIYVTFRGVTGFISCHAWSCSLNLRLVVAAAAVPKIARNAGILVSQCADIFKRHLHSRSVALQVGFGCVRCTFRVCPTNSAPSVVCVLQGRRYSTAQDTRRPQFDFGLPDSRSFRAQDAPYSIRPNTSYRAPSAQITAVGRANQELGQIVKQRKGPEAFAFAARMKEQGIVPNGNTYDFLLEACKDASLVPEAWAVFEDMLAVGILPTRSTFHLLLHVR